MECAECSVRSSVGYCHECEILLCEVCSNQCERCNKSFCRSHIQRTSSGRSICVSCVVDHYESRAKQSKELREKRATRAELGRKKRKVRSEVPEGEASAKGKKSAAAGKGGPAREDLSFASLTEGEELPSQAIPEYTAPAEASELDGTPVYDKEALNKRVLTGSARSRSPVGLTGLLLGLFSWCFVFGAYRAEELGAQRAILILIAFVLAVGTLVWTGPRAFSKEAGADRTRARVAVFVGGVAFLLTGLIYVVRGMNS